MTFFNYLDAHPVLSFVWFCLIVCASYAVPVTVWHACTPRRRSVVTEITGRGGF